jgi:hypothetical protein
MSGQNITQRRKEKRYAKPTTALSHREVTGKLATSFAPLRLYVSITPAAY